MPSEELFYFDSKGVKQDAMLHDFILDGGNDDAALAVSRALARELGLTEPIKRAQAQALLARGTWNEADHPRGETGPGTTPGSFAPGGGGGSSGGTSSDKPKGGGKKKVKKEDFDKAKIALSVSSEAAFLDRWNEKVGMEPEEFKKGFMGGVNGTMTIGAVGASTTFDIAGQIQGTGEREGALIGTFRREIDLDDKEAYSAFFNINKSSTGSNIGKKILAGNVEIYEKLGIEQVRVSANIDVGGYAWAKYGYVPTQDSWDFLRTRLETKLTGGGSGGGSPSRGENTMEADSWDMLSTDQQADVRDRWMRDSFDEFLSSEVQSWRDSGQALDDAKSELAVSPIRLPDWAGEAIDAARAKREEAGQPPIPYTNDQIIEAISIEYEADGEGRNDPEIEFDDDRLREPEGAGDPAQQTLPGIEPEDLSQRLTEKMREEITTRLIHQFEIEAEKLADEMDPPDLSDSVHEYQEMYWEEKDDSDKLEEAIGYGLADIEIEPEEDEEEPEAELDLPKPELDPLLAAVRSRDPKSIWAVADSPRGKELLLGRNWVGYLKLKDAASMARFKEYVGRAKHA
jgi:hypothetical protein